jgi:transcriptional regulator with XRE-family HTH domain
MGSGERNVDSIGTKINLKAFRVSSGHTIKKVAEYCNVSTGAIQRYENNPSRLPLYLIIQLSKLYGVSPNSLVATY